MPAVVLVSVWKDMGFFGLILLSGIDGHQTAAYYEAAELDGAGAWTKVYPRITLPLLTPSIFYVVIVAMINGFQLFPQVMIMTGGGPERGHPGHGGADLSVRLPVLPDGVRRGILLDLVCHHHGVYRHPDEGTGKVGPL